MKSSRTNFKTNKSMVSKSRPNFGLNSILRSALRHHQPSSNMQQAILIPPSLCCTLSCPTSTCMLTCTSTIQFMNYRFLLRSIVQDHVFQKPAEYAQPLHEYVPSTPTLSSLLIFYLKLQHKKHSLVYTSWLIETDVSPICMAITTHQHQPPSLYPSLLCSTESTMTIYIYCMEGFVYGMVHQPPYVIATHPRSSQRYIHTRAFPHYFQACSPSLLLSCSPAPLLPCSPAPFSLMQ